MQKLAKWNAITIAGRLVVVVAFVFVCISVIQGIIFAEETTKQPTYTDTRATGGSTTSDEDAAGADAPVLYAGDEAKLDSQTGNLFLDIPADNVPLGNIAIQGAWSVLSMVLAAIAMFDLVIVIIVTIILKLRRNAEYKKILETDGIDLADIKLDRRGTQHCTLVICSAVLTPAVWLMMDNINMPTVFINNGTVYVAIVFVAHLALLFSYLYYSRNKGRSNVNLSQRES
jgi:hypothetical protein